MMKAKTLAMAAISLITCGFIAVAGFAQEGHPMTGSWVGEWGTPNDPQRNRVVIVMEWTGSELVGTINPGANAVPIKTARVDPTNWRLQMEADAMDAQNRPVTYVIDGVIDDLGTYNRTIAGTWNVGNEQGIFSITRQ